MTRQNATNYSGALQFPYANTAADLFKKEDVQVLAQAVDQHDHTAGKGKSVAPTNASITNAMLGSDVARANLLTNGGFEIWQRGPGSFASVNGQYNADRWIQNIIGTDLLPVQRDSANADTSLGSAYCVACSFTLGSGAGATRLYQQIAVPETQLAGRTVTFSARVRTSTANAVRIAINNFTGSSNITYSSFHTGGGAYETLSVTVTMSASATYCQTAFYFAASCTAYIDNAMLVVGSQPSDYAPLHPADDLARCMRYYEVFAVGNGAGIATMLCMNASTAIGGFNWRTIKPVTPTVTFTGPWAVTYNGGASSAVTPATAGQGVSSCQLVGNGATSLTGGQAGVLGSSGSGSAMSIEANP